jgi:hypothetical protein
VGVGSIAERGVRTSRWRPVALWHDIAGEPALAAVAALVVAGAALRFYGLNHQGYWYDEANTVFLVRHSFGQMLGVLPSNESTPPFYYCLAWLWTQVLGSGEAGLRSLSALSGVLVIPVAYALGAAAATRRVGLVLAALVAFNPLLIWYSQEARAYALMVLLTAVTLLALARAARRPEPRPVAAWAVTSGLALTTHYYAVLVVAPQALWLLWQHRRRRAVQVAVAAIVACGLALIPLALSQNGTHRDRWISRAPLGPRVNQLIPHVLIGPGVPDRPLVKFIAFAAALAGLALLALRANGAERRPAAAAGLLVLTGVGMSFAFVLAGYDGLITRNLIALTVPVLVVLAAGFGARRAGHLGLLAAGVLCAMGLIAAVGVAADRDLQRPDWRPLIRMLGPPPRHAPGRALIVQHYHMLLPLSLYMRGLRRIDPRIGARVNQIDVIAISSPRVGTCWWGAACNLRSTQPQSSYPFRGFHFAWRRRVLQFTVEHFVSRHPVRIRAATVAPVLTETRLGKDDFLYQR